MRVTKMSCDAEADDETDAAVRRTTEASVSRRCSEITGASPILAPLPGVNFSRLLAEVHHELVNEIDQPR